MRTLLALILFGSLCLPATMGETGVRTPPREAEDPTVTTWLSKSEAHRLMRYHGVLALKITADKVFIRRDGRWICVYHDPPYPREQSIASGRAWETLLAATGDP